MPQYFRPPPHLCLGRVDEHTKLLPGLVLPGVGNSKVVGRPRSVCVETSLFFSHLAAVEGSAGSRAHWRKGSLHLWGAAGVGRVEGFPACTRSPRVQMVLALALQPPEIVLRSCQQYHQTGWVTSHSVLNLHCLHFPYLNSASQQVSESRASRHRKELHAHLRVDCSSRHTLSHSFLSTRPPTVVPRFLCFVTGDNYICL